MHVCPSMSVLLVHEHLGLKEPEGLANIWIFVNGGTRCTMFIRVDHGTNPQSMMKAII